MIILIRHGETALNAARIVQPADTPLSERGIAQAELLATRLADLGVAHILCSHLPRARMTAEPIARATGSPIEEDALFEERNFGDIRGTPYAELRQDIFAVDYQPPGGETFAEFERRVERAWALTVERAASCAGNLAVVTHGLLCRVAATRHLGLGPQSPRAWSNCSVTLIDPLPPHAVSVVNCTMHLADATSARPGGAV